MTTEKKGLAKILSMEDNPYFLFLILILLIQSDNHEKKEVGKSKSVK